LVEQTFLSAVPGMVTYHDHLQRRKPLAIPLSVRRLRLRAFGCETRREAASGVRTGILMKLPSFMSARRSLIFLALSLALVGCTAVHSTNRPTASLTPQETAAQWNDGRLATMSFEQAMALYNVKTPTEKQLAEVMAAQMLATAKLESVVRERWGNDAKNRISHVCMDSTADDVAQATWTISPDRAAARFKPEGMSPLLMIRVNGAWKIDVAAYVADVGDQLQPTVKLMKGTTASISRTTDELTRSKAYPTADHLARHLQAEFNRQPSAR